MVFPTVSPQNFADETFPIGFDDQISGIARDSSGNVYYGGHFESVATELTGCVAIVDPTNGDPISGVFPRFRVAGGLYGSPPSDSVCPGVCKVISDGGSGWYVAGSFRSVAGMPSSWDNMSKLVVHILSDGSVDPNFQVQLQYESDDGYGAYAPGVYDLHLDTTNNVLYLGGRFPAGPLDSNGFATYANLVAVNPTTGALLTEWQPFVMDGSFDNSNVSIIKFLVDGSKLYIAGDFALVNSQIRLNLARFTITSFPPTLDAFNAGTDAPIFAIATYGSNIYIGGGFSVIYPSDGGFVGRNGAAKLDPAGSLDAWNPNVGGSVYSIVGFADQIYLGGEFSSIGVTAINSIARVNNTDGSLDTGWDPTTTNGWNMFGVYSMLFDGPNVYLGGSFYPAVTITPRSSPNPTNAVRINITTTAVDTIWAPGPVLNSAAFGFLKSGSNIIFWHDSPGLKRVIRTGLVKFDSGGNFVSAFNPQTSITVPDNGSDPLAVISITSGTVLAVARSGGVSLFDPTNGNLIGSVTTNLSVYTILQPASLGSTNFFIGGNFSSVGTLFALRGRVALINGTTFEAESWNPNITNGEVYDLYYGTPGAVSTIYIGGSFSGVSIQSQTRNRACSVSATTGTIDLTFNPNCSGTVECIETWNSNILLGGGFLTIGGLTARGLAEVNPSTGSLVQEYNTKTSPGLPQRVSVGSNGRLYATCQYILNGIYPRSILAEYAPGSTTPTLWNTGVGAPNYLYWDYPGWAWFTDFSTDCYALLATDDYLYIGTWDCMGFGGTVAIHGFRVKYPDRLNLLGTNQATGEFTPIAVNDTGTTTSGGLLFGFTGISGLTGLQGITGVGIRGPVGIVPDGDTGIQGFTGLGGIAGITGSIASTSQGITGFIGITGIQGLMGRSGVAGVTGLVATTSNTAVSTSPFTVTINHHILLVNTSIPITLDLPSPATVGAGKLYGVYDSSGNAGTNSITITPAIGVINGQSSFIINAAYGSADIYSDGNNYYARSFENGVTGVTGSIGITGLVGA